MFGYTFFCGSEVKEVKLSKEYDYNMCLADNRAAQSAWLAKHGLVVFSSSSHSDSRGRGSSSSHYRGDPAGIVPSQYGGETTADGYVFLEMITNEGNYSKKTHGDDSSYREELYGNGQTSMSVMEILLEMKKLFGKDSTMVEDHFWPMISKIKCAATEKTCGDGRREYHDLSVKFKEHAVGSDMVIDGELTSTLFETVKLQFEGTFEEALKWATEVANPIIRGFYEAEYQKKVAVKKGYDVLLVEDGKFMSNHASDKLFDTPEEAYEEQLTEARMHKAHRELEHARDKVKYDEMIAKKLLDYVDKYPTTVELIMDKDPKATILKELRALGLPFPEGMKKLAVKYKTPDTVLWGVFKGVSEMPDPYNVKGIYKE